MLSLAWLMVLLHPRVGPSVYVIMTCSPWDLERPANYYLISKVDHDQVDLHMPLLKVSPSNESIKLNAQMQKK